MVYLQRVVQPCIDSFGWWTELSACLAVQLGHLLKQRISLHQLPLSLLQL